MSIVSSHRLLLCAFVISLGWTSGGGGVAQGSEPARYKLTIASQPLSHALQEFAKQSGIQVIFFSRITDGLRAPALEGEYTMAGALTALLADSQLTFRVLNPKTVEIRLPVVDKTARPAATAQEKAVPHDRDSAARTASSNASDRIEEVIVTGMAEGLVATRTQTPLREIPQTIAIITNEQMRQQNDTDLAEALDHATGITSRRSDSLNKRFFARGFEITAIHVDGGAALDSLLDGSVLFMGTPDLSEFDHIEVLRGADALFGGNGNPGATVSMVRKRPLRDFKLEMNASAGSWNYNRVEADVTGPLAQDGALRGRFDVTHSASDSFMDVASQRKLKLFAALEYDLTPATLVTIGGSYQRLNALPVVGGLPRYEDGRDANLPRDTALAFDWSRTRSTMRELYLQLRQEFGDRWALKVNTATWRRGLDLTYAGFDSQIDPLTNALPVAPLATTLASPPTDRQVAVDVTLTGAFDWFGMREDFALGADFAEVKHQFDLTLLNRFGSPLSNVYTFDPTDYPQPDFSRETDGLGSRQSNTTRGVYASLRAHLTDDWSVIGGARIGSDRSTVDVTGRTLGFSQRFRIELGNSHVVTPYAGVMYDIDDHLSVYASYADIHQTFNVSRRADGSELGAANGTDIEAGIKSAWHDGALNGALVLYRIDQRDVPLFDPSQRALAPDCCYRSGTNHSKGVDIEFNGMLQPSWLIGAGYSFNENRSAAGGELSSWTPRHLLKAWTSRQLGGRLQRLNLSGSVHAQTSNSLRGAYCPLTGAPPRCRNLLDYDVEQRPYAVIDLRASLNINANWQASLTANNVFDRVYYETIGEPTGGNWYGEPRGFQLRIDGRY